MPRRSSTLKTTKQLIDSAQPSSDVVGNELSSFNVRKQQKSNWCWAAIASAVRAHFQPSAKLKQCDVAKLVVPDVNCCTRSGGTQCNVVEDLRGPLNDVGHFNGFNSGKATDQFKEITDSIDDNRPLCLALAVDGGTHFVAVSGYSYVEGGSTSDQRIDYQSSSPAKTYHKPLDTIFPSIQARYRTS